MQRLILRTERAVQVAGGAEPFELIPLGGEAAAIVPVSELRRLRAVEARAPADVLEAAEADAVLTVHDEWVAAGRSGTWLIRMRCVRGCRRLARQRPPPTACGTATRRFLAVS
jgi:hypothetical protein